ncbi:uncharacterized protein NDAI_0K00990 [Naumovozyma dairenensis CBS 421]|uniref:AMMECR1 domain-containing protein n=1 Tax=Naumovozyma dairenensis (strain ATCC 10597 / BCRC 20456 / CBS 421 / NBRC 0211 / NRRL Y-12639) TaxID=1071378 RepID=G0WHM9_NAUDC|nr:hypothetical protein NDAI_0K00990 [Naumovozyma dairenensis CBS 421]CCD27290.1 hypothetical protein NDAI_0K00990 [Naumovozyma dairenensis CBS 421]
MAKETLKSSPYAFYAFYQLYLHFFHKNKGITFQQIEKVLYPNYPVDLNTKKSLFITWKKKNSNGDDEEEYDLRGCIGTFAKLNILNGIERYSLVAALEDDRFSPIKAKELSKLKCSCNILDSFKTIYPIEDDDDNSEDGIYDWEIGKHGIEVKLIHPHTKTVHSATFLPEVMVEQNWDKDETFQYLIDKSGLWNYIDKIMANKKLYFKQVIRYEGHKSLISYDEFIEKLKVLEENV